MSQHQHTIFGFVGTSGSGKTTLMIELLNFFPHLEIIKSTSTRPKRDDTDDLFYKLVDTSYFESEQNRAGLLNHEHFDGHEYAYEKAVLDRVLLAHCGMFAILEQAVPTIRDKGYDLKLIKIVADRDWELERTRERQTADSARTGIEALTYDLIVENSFKPEGLKQSVEKVAGFIHESIISHLTRL